MSHKYFTACGSCAHATEPTKKHQNVTCEVWKHRVSKRFVCDYYLHLNAPVNPFEGVRSPMQREYDLKLLREFIAFEHNTDFENTRFFKWHNDFYKNHLNNY